MQEATHGSMQIERFLVLSTICHTCCRTFIFTACFAYTKGRARNRCCPSSSCPLCHGPEDCLVGAIQMSRSLHIARQETEHCVGSLGDTAVQADIHNYISIITPRWVVRRGFYGAQSVSNSPERARFEAA